MASQVGTAVIKLEFDGKSLSASLDKAVSSAKSSGEKSGSSFGGAWAVAAGSLIAKGLGKVASSISGAMDKAIKRADILNNFPKIMANFGVSADESSAAIDRIKNRMEGLPTSLDEAASGVRNLFLVTKDLGQAEELFYAVNDAAMIFANGSSEAVDRFIYAYRQALSAGKVQAQDFNQMNEAIPGVMDKVAESMGITFVELKEGLSNGSISMEQFNNALKKLDKEGVGNMKAMEQGAKESTGGIGTALENLQTRIGGAIEKIISHIGVDRISNAINDISSNFSGMANVIVGALDFIHEHWNIIGPIVATLGTIAGIIIGINLATKAYHKTVEAVTGVVNTFKGTFEKIQSVFTGAKEKIDSMKTSVGSLGSKMSKADVGGQAEKIGDGFDRMIEKIKNVIRKVSEVITEVIKAIKEPLKEAIKSVGEILTELVNALVEPLKAALKGVGEAIAGFFKAFADPMIAVGALMFAAAAASVALAILMIGGAISAVTPGLTEFLNNIIMPIANFIRDTVLMLIDKLTESVIKLTNEAIIPLGNFLKGAFIEILKAVTNAMIVLTNGAVIPLINTFSGAFIAVINTVTDCVIRLTNSALIPLINTIAGSLIGIINALGGTIRGIIDSALNGLIGVINAIGDGFTKMGWAIQTALNGVSGVLYAFAELIRSIASAAVAIVAMVTGHSINYGAGYAHLFAEGGRVIGPGTATSDSIPAMLSNGEYVIKASSAKAIGYDNLDNINDSGMLPRQITHNLSSNFEDMFTNSSEGLSGRPITVYMTNEINNEMDAEDIGRKLMTSIRRAA